MCPPMASVTPSHITQGIVRCKMITVTDLLAVTGVFRCLSVSHSPALSDTHCFTLSLSLAHSRTHTHWNALPHIQHLPVFPSHPPHHSYSCAGPTGRGSIPHIFIGGKVKEGAAGWEEGPMSWSGQGPRS